MIILYKQSRPSTGEGGISCNNTEAIVDAVKLKGGVG